jgi:septal ring factor EnvC (AmiA/AmiB activator)
VSGTDRRLMLAAVAMLAVAVPACAQSTQDQSTQDLDQIQQQIEQGQQQSDALKARAKQLDQEIADLQAAMVKAAKDVQDTESKVTDLEQTLDQLEQTAHDKNAALEKEQGRLASALMALQRLSRQPPQTILFSPEPPIDAARTARLLSLITPALDARARALQSDLSELREVRAEMAARRDSLAAAVTKLAGDNRSLSDLLAKKASLQQQTLSESAATTERIDKLADQAKNLQDLIERLDKAKAKAGEPEEGQTAAESSGTAPAETGSTAAADAAKPADTQLAAAETPTGKITVNFADPQDSGGQSKGMMLETRPHAQIVAPFDGQIVFEGPFRSYGQILIIEHGGGYHTVLAGLGRADAVVGQWLLAGEPVGVMGSPDTGHPQLYLELRRDGQPIDPAPWFGLNVTKAVNSKGQ